MTLTPEQYEELAQRIVAQGVGHESGGTYSVHQRITEDNYMTPYRFCNDWRVAGAMMEKCLKDREAWRKVSKMALLDLHRLASNFPASINLACCDALETI